VSTPRILIIRTDRIGDVILSTPVIRALRQALPEAHIGMMVRPEHRELVEGNADLNEVLLYDKRGREKSIWGSLKFARRLKTHCFDTALILHSTNRVILVSWLAGIPRRVGYARRLPWLLTHAVPYIKREGIRHELEYNLDLLRLIDVEAREQALSVPARKEQEETVGRFLRECDFREDRPLVVLHPGASCPSKRWPAERFAELADQLISQFGVAVALVTGPDQIVQGQAVAREMKHPAIQALGTLSLGEVACLLKKARCLISNDSGPVHLAAAVGTPAAVIFGRWGGGLSPTRWGPIGPHNAVLHKDVGCRPCTAHRCSIGFICLEAISVQEVLAAAQRIGALIATDNKGL